MLLYDNKTYIQVLEDSEKDVHEIFKSIQNDARNNAVVKLLEEEIDQRDFPDWSMGFSNLKSCSPEEVAGFSDIFNYDPNQHIADNKQAKAVRLLLNFAKNAYKNSSSEG